MPADYKKILLIVLALVFAMSLLIYPKLTKTPEQKSTNNSNHSNFSSIDPNASPKIVSTKPDPLEEAIISATEVVEITFNRPLENVGEFKSRIEPKIEYKVELSGDRKTARIHPLKPYELGITYTLFIKPDSKFDGVGEWRQDKTFHFKTVKYRGV